jgi:hypothetical protein
MRWKKRKDEQEKNENFEIDWFSYIHNERMSTNNGRFFIKEKDTPRKNIPILVYLY